VLLARRDRAQQFVLGIPVFMVSIARVAARWVSARR
jgi:hypothetical protein